MTKEEISSALSALGCIPCGTCGKDIQTVKQLIECRRHYVEDLRVAEAALEAMTKQRDRLLDRACGMISGGVDPSIAESFKRSLRQAFRPEGTE